MNKASRNRPVTILRMHHRGQPTARASISSSLPPNQHAAVVTILSATMQMNIGSFLSFFLSFFPAPHYTRGTSSFESFLCVYRGRTTHYREWLHPVFEWFREREWFHYRLSKDILYQNIYIYVYAIMMKQFEKKSENKFCCFFLDTDLMRDNCNWSIFPRRDYIITVSSCAIIIFAALIRSFQHTPLPARRGNALMTVRRLLPPSGKIKASAPRRIIIWNQSEIPQTRLIIARIEHIRVTFFYFRNRNDIRSNCHRRVLTLKFTEIYKTLYINETGMCVLSLEYRFDCVIYIGKCHTMIFETWRFYVHCIYIFHAFRA